MFQKLRKPDIIEISGRTMVEITEKTLQAVKVANVPPQYFVYKQKLARLVSDPHSGRLVIQPLSEAALKGELARTLKFKRKGKGVVEPPRHVVQDILSLPEWDLPVLRGLVSLPIVRPDGTISDTPGYDAVTGLYYEKPAGLKIPRIPAKPTLAEVAAAADLVREIVCDFPFDCAASRANTIGLLLTPVLRTAIRGLVPLAAIDATKGGTGKGFLGNNPGQRTGHLAVVGTERRGGSKAPNNRHLGDQSAGRRAG